jgi:FtsH-binding integral membrane protein
MLSVTVAFTACMMADAFGDSQKFVYENRWLYYVSLAIVIGIMLGMTCFYKKCRTVPKNYILLGTYTIFHTYLIAAISIQYNPLLVLYAAIATLLMFLALTIYAWKTKTDFTKMGGLLSTCSFLVIFFIIVAAVFRSQILYTAIICVAIGLLSMFIIYDTQLIIGGKSKYNELELDDYCLGALIIYSDIVTIFSYLLALFG